MPDTIPQHYTTQFHQNWINRAQQKTSRLLPYVTPAPFTGERKRFSRSAEQEMTKIVTRKGDTPITDPSDDLRWLYMTGVELGNDLDQFDAHLLGEVVLPTSQRVNAAAMAYNRAVDREILEAASGTVMTGENGTSASSLPGGNAIAQDYVETGGATNSGLTVAKLRRAREIFLANDIDLDGEDGSEEAAVLAVTGRQLINLLRTTEITSSDYNTVKALVEGKVDTFLGFKFRRVSAKVAPKSGDVRTCVAWVKSAILFNAGEKKTTIDRIPDKQNKIQIYTTALLGGMRLHDEGVVTIACNEAV